MFDQLFKLTVMGHAKAVDIPGVVPLEPGPTDLESVATNLIDFALIVGGSLAVVYIIYGGIAYMTAGGDKAKADQARNTITYAIIGVIIIALSYVILNWVTKGLNLGIPVENI